MWRWAQQVYNKMSKADKNRCAAANATMNNSRVNVQVNQNKPKPTEAEIHCREHQVRTQSVKYQKNT